MGQLGGSIFFSSQETPMKRSTRQQRPLLEPWLAWQELPDVVRQHVLDILTALYLETVDSPNSEHQTNDSSPA
jgi:hypothetical protein